MGSTTLAAAAAAAAIAGFAPGTPLYVPGPNPEAQQQIAALTSSGDRSDAALISAMQAQPRAVWLTGGTPNDARVLAQKTVLRAAGRNELPVLVLYDIPFRDCSQYSAGGALDTAGYEAWVDGVAAGIADRPALVLLEPDSLGIIPNYKQFMGTPEEGGYEWCRPTDPGATPAARFEQLRYAVHALKALPHTSVYLDATHSNWLGAGDAAHRLLQAGVDDADGFFLNVSNFELTSHLVKYGTWISQCLAITENVPWWHVGWCASQYYPADPADFSTWHLTDEAYAGMSWAIEGVPLKHFVVDTSRNGAGPWPGPDPETWCNPPDRGLGARPTTETGEPLVDAYVWAKVPGESDGTCRGGPPAGAWFPRLALELARHASPALLP
jgi:endoglucanase